MNKTSTPYEWSVIGAGPAGIAAVGKLLDSGIDAHSIAWVDPAFQVGDFGSKWASVPSNTQVHLFKKFFHGCKAFDFSKAGSFEIDQLPEDETCELRCAVEPLLYISDHLKKQVNCLTGTAQHLSLSGQAWEIQTDKQNIEAKKVILAIGSVPNTLPLPDVNEISLENAIDADRLNQCCGANETVGVFGSSHSAILVLRRLLEKPVKKVINFYLEPLKYAVYFKDWILFDNTGLKGNTADWAREHIDNQLPDNLLRVCSTDENINEYLSECDKVVYAVGFGWGKQLPSNSAGI